MADKPEGPATDKRRQITDAERADWELFERDREARARAIVHPVNPLWEPRRPDPRRDAPVPSRQRPPDGGRKDRPA